jgi:hypothetical protein
MKRFAIVAAIVLSLTGCAGWQNAAGIGLGGLGVLLGAAPPPAGAIVLDQTKLTAANHLARSVADNLTAAFTSGAIARSNDPDTGRPRANFCAMVMADLATITDEGGRALALGCRIEHHLDRAGAAFDARDPVAFADNLAKADSYTNQLAELVRAANARGSGQ